MNEQDKNEATRLRRALREAYEEGWLDRAKQGDFGTLGRRNMEECWKSSHARQAAKEKA